MVYPPIILLGADSPIGLTIIRDLGKRGVPVYGLAWSERGLGLYSRYLFRGEIRVNNEGLISQINKLGDESGAKWLMAVSEDDILFLQKHADELRGVKPLIPDSSSFSKVLNKVETVEVAISVNIRVPKTWQLKSSKAIDEIASELKFPLVAKWSNPLIVREKLKSIGFELEKLRYIYSLQELKAYFKPLDKIKVFPMIQEFVPGYGLGQMFHMHQGKAVLRFQHKRIAEWPPEGGVSAVCESVDINEHAELQLKSIKLLNELNWSGPAMVEYRFDPKTKSAVLMEINGRFWGSLPLAYYANAKFAWVNYACNVLGQVPEDVVYKSGVTCRFFVPEIKRLFVVLFRQGAIQNRKLSFNKVDELVAFFKRYLKPFHHWYVFSMDDPKPFFMDMQFIVKSIFKKVVP